VSAVLEGAFDGSCIYASKFQVGRYWGGMAMV
jgi:hypothetical protein